MASPSIQLCVLLIACASSHCYVIVSREPSRPVMSIRLPRRTNRVASRDGVELVAPLVAFNRLKNRLFFCMRIGVEEIGRTTDESASARMVASDRVGADQVAGAFDEYARGVLLIRSGKQAVIHLGLAVGEAGSVR